MDPNGEERGERGAEAAGTGEVAPEVGAEEREARGEEVAAEAGVGIDEERERAEVEKETIGKRETKTREIMRSKRRGRKKDYLQ